MTKTKKTVLAVIIGVLILALGAGIGVIAASTYGTQADPLVAKSYLDDTLTPQLQQQFQAQLDSKAQELEQKISSSGGAFSAVSLSAGQSLYCGAGCEIILSSGGATASGSSGFSDVTSGEAVNLGASLQANHLYVASAEGSAVSSPSGATVLVRGRYTMS